jgi:hypothetical protein
MRDNRKDPRDREADEDRDREGPSSDRGFQPQNDLEEEPPDIDELKSNLGASPTDRG